MMPERRQHVEFVEEMAGGARNTFWTRALGGVLLPLGLSAKGWAVISAQRMAFYGPRGIHFHDPLVVTGQLAVLFGAVWLCGAALAHFHFFWPHRNHTLCAYGKAIALAAGAVLLFVGMTKLCMQ
jgi:uncharacterized membrane protein HdeD (DUF308 family)